MTIGVARRVTLLWMLATTAHVPVPVWDGDPPACAGAISAVAESPLARLCELIDFVRLGCRTPHELDNFPFDDEQDERNDSLGMFPAYLTARESESHGTSAEFPLMIVFDLAGRETSLSFAGPSSHGRLIRFAPDRERRFGGRLLQVMRC